MAEQNNGQIYTVSGLTREIKTLLEERFPFVWVSGEISNYVVPASGHSYFSLKDATAVISCVMFKNQKRALKFRPENGLKIVGLARLSLYEPRGSYQLIFEHLEPEGLGSLQKAFEQLKNMLADEGLFDTAHKQPLPFLPQKINVITSGTGAAVRDIIHIASRRFPRCCLEIVPVKVQGNEAVGMIVYAIEAVNRLERSDLIILARGGGSMEDLAAFNSESVARAIFASKIPVITGIGHETDFTIADFVADVRAPTPSGAAELALPEYEALVQRITDLKTDLAAAMDRKTAFLNQRLDDLHGRLKSPSQVVADYKLRVAENMERINRTFDRQVLFGRDKLLWMARQLGSLSPDTGKQQEVVTGMVQALRTAMTQRIEQNRTRLREQAAALSALGPQAVLDRGYSITRTLPGHEVVLDSRDVTMAQSLEIILSRGKLNTRVEKAIDGEKDI